MYKTVRHGDNSLQYTILPQQDDAGVSGGGLCRRNGRTRRRGRLPLVLMITLILAGGAVAAAILIPLLVTSDLVTLPAALQRLAINHHMTHGTHPPRPNTTTPPPTTSEENFNTLTTSANYYNKTSEHKDEDDNDDENISSTKAPQVLFNEGTSNDNITSKSSFQSVTTVQSPTTERVVEISTATEITDTVSNTQEGLASTSSQKNTTSRLVEALMPAGAFNSTNKTTQLGSEAQVAAPTTVVLEVNTKTVLHPTPKPKLRSWWQPRWIFSDPSSYFQWTGYNRRDSLLLPLILGAALVILIMAAGMCYALRRRRQKKLRRQTIGKISSDLQAGDKATLLPDGSEEE